MFGQAADVDVTDASELRYGYATKSTKERKHAQAGSLTLLRVCSHALSCDAGCRRSARPAAIPHRTPQTAAPRPREFFGCPVVEWQAPGRDITQCACQWSLEEQPRGTARGTHGGTHDGVHCAHHRALLNEVYRDAGWKAAAARSPTPPRPPPGDSRELRSRYRGSGECFVVCGRWPYFDRPKPGNVRSGSVWWFGCCRITNAPALRYHQRN